MEYILGKISTVFSSKITNPSVSGDEWDIIVYQRLTVLIGDVLLFVSIRKLCLALNFPKSKFCLLLVSIQSFAGLVIVDNIHFQYNTLLFSIFFFSIDFIAREKFIKGAIVFSIAVCFKHIFIYMAPAFVVFYLQNYVFRAETKKEKVIRFVNLGLTLGLVVIASFSPFILLCLKEGNLNQLIQIKNQLFPFQRGLLHSYWAPNIWAIYSFIDKVLFFSMKSSSDIKSKNTSALGVTQETSFDVLPNISSASSTMLLATVLLLYLTKQFILPLRKIDPFEEKNINQMIAIIKKRKQNIKKILKDCMISNLIFFNFGYQVHEKAFIIISLMMLIYFFCQGDNEQKYFYNILFMALSIGILAQMPLIHDYRDYIAKLCLVITYFGFIFAGLVSIETINKQTFVYIGISIVLDFIAIFKPIEFIKRKYPFLPLMGYSVLSACFVQMFFSLLLLKEAESYIC